MAAAGGAWRLTYQAKTKKELLHAYRMWAPTYDADACLKFGYAAPKTAASVLAKYRKPSDLVLDVGVGTGLVGQQLSLMGFNRLCGIDLSPEMLAQAERKKVYQRLILGDIADLSSSHSSLFQAAICVGTFTPNHVVDASALFQVCSTVQKFGHLVLTLREDFLRSETSFRVAMDQLVEGGEWELVNTTDPEFYTPLADGADEVLFRCWVYRRIAW